MDTVTVVAVYVDDLVLIAKTANELQKVKESLSSRFKMKDMGKIHYCLRISIEQDEERKCLRMHEKQYIENNYAGEISSNRCQHCFNSSRPQCEAEER